MNPTVEQLKLDILQRVMGLTKRADVLQVSAVVDTVLNNQIENTATEEKALIQLAQKGLAEIEKGEPLGSWKEFDEAFDKGVARAEAINKG